MSKGDIKLVSFVIVLFLMAFGFFDSSSKPETVHSPVSQTVKDDRVEKYVAYHTAIEMIQDQLVAPSTAKFQKFDYDLVRTVDYCTWIINSYVDSQNSFGAMIRTRYRAKIMKVSEDSRGARWKMLDFKTYQ